MHYEHPNKEMLTKLISLTPFPLVNFPALISIVFWHFTSFLLKQDELFYGQITPLPRYME